MTSDFTANLQKPKRDAFKDDSGLRQQMPPTVSVHDAGHAMASEAKVTRDACVSLARRHATTNRDHVGFGQPLPTEGIAAGFLDAVVNVVVLRAEEQVRGIDAVGIVAAVTDADTVRNGLPVRQLPGNDVGVPTRPRAIRSVS